MLHYGYDESEGHLFMYDGEFRYLGVTDSPPMKRKDVGSERMAARLTGSYFLSGNRDPAWNIWSDGEEAYNALSYLKNGVICHGNLEKPGAVPHLVPICICGSICENPEKISQFCASYSHSTVFACPIVPELPSFGAITKLMSPHRAFIAEPCDLPIQNSKGQEFDPALEGDGLGRMADVVSKGKAVWNQMMRVVGISPFYGKLISNDGSLGDRGGVFLVMSEVMDEFFPTEPISSKYYAATSVPVRMKTTEKFRKSTGVLNDEVDVVVVSDHIRGLPDFMRFYKLMSGRDWVVSIDPKDYKDGNGRKKRPVWRYNKGWMVSDMVYKAMIENDWNET